MRILARLAPTTTERVLLPSGREEALPKATLRFPRWTDEFPWSTYGGKPILDLCGELSGVRGARPVAPPGARDLVRPARAVHI